MKRIPVVLNETEAHFVRGLLAVQRIQADVRGNQSLWSASGVGSDSAASLWICVDERDFVRADRIIAQYMRQRRRPTQSRNASHRAAIDAWTCWRCGEAIETQFAVCWNCGADRLGDWV